MTCSGDHGFRHEALVFETEAEFLAVAVPFVREGVQAGEPVMVAVTPGRIAALQHELGADAGAVRFADMTEMGRNPGRIIPAWLDFLSDCGERGAARGIGEPIWAGRSEHELVECHRHEALLNLAFADADGFTLLCPYDASALDPAVVEEAHRTHPHMRVAGEAQASTRYAGLETLTAPLAEPLAPPPVPVVEFEVTLDSLSELRRVVAGHAMRAQLGEMRTGDLVLAIDELATNGLRHGRRPVRARVWDDGEALVCEIADGGRIDDPLAGRIRPTPDQFGGWGLWLVNQVCDLVQLRSSGAGTVVRVDMRHESSVRTSGPLSSAA